MPEAPFRIHLRQARLARKLTQAAVAKALRVSQSAVAQWESGRSFPSPELAAPIERLLGAKVGTESGGPAPRTHGATRKRARLPIVGLPAPGDQERIIIDGSSRGEIAAPPQLENVAGAKAMYVRGRSMEPRYFQGEVVYLDPNRPPNPGDFVMVTVKEPNYPAAIAYIRRYLGEDLVHVHLGTLNPKRDHLIARQNLVSLATIVGSGLF
ncbi:MAG: helix-turn-helix domain-containing protein [Hyphomicrobiales bacterium]|nr:helix-turn-helix domain-containing protein [Hyphomicrobiales bacterium]